LVKEIEKEQYQQFWKKNNGSPLQSWDWGEVKKETWEVMRLGVFEDEKLVAVANVFIRILPFSVIMKMLGATRFAYIPRGICVKSCGKYPGIMRELTNHFSILEVAFILIDPDLRFDTEEWNDSMQKAFESNGWGIGGMTIDPNQTNIVKLQKTEEELLKAMKPKWRRNIKKAIRQGVTVKEVSDDSAIDSFYSVMQLVVQNTDFKIREKAYFERIWRELKPDELVKIFVAEYKGEVVSSYLVLINDYAAYEIYGGATKKGRDVEASYLLKWEIMKKMKAEEKKYYDHWGVAPKEDSNHPLSGISYFKSGFGGRYVQLLPQYVKVFNRKVYSLYTLGKRFIKH